MALRKSLLLTASALTILASATAFANGAKHAAPVKAEHGMHKEHAHKGHAHKEHAKKDQTSEKDVTPTATEEAK